VATVSIRAMAAEVGVSHTTLSRHVCRDVVRNDEKLTAFLELQRATHEFAVSLFS
jgi:hypothetical protein